MAIKSHTDYVIRRFSDIQVFLGAKIVDERGIAHTRTQTQHWKIVS